MPRAFARPIALACTFVLATIAALAPGWLATAGATRADGLAPPNGVPLCPHDPTRWHPLVERNSDGSVRCTYGHEHGMDPRQADAVFGPLSVPGGQEISYPWATVSAAGIPENGPDYKHRSYKWEVAQGLPCTAFAPNGARHDITALRLEAHNDGNLGASARFHSYWLEAQLTDCATGEQGYLSIGGHEDFAHLLAGDLQLVPLPGDPPSACVLNGDGRHEGLIGGDEQTNSVWYGAASRAGKGCDDYYGDDTPAVGVQYNIGTDSWGPIDPADPGALLFYPNREQHHGTRTGTNDVTIYVPRLVDATGHVTISGFADRHGRLVPTCDALGPDCIPVTIKNALPGPYTAAKGVVGYDGDVPGPNGERGFYVQTPSLNSPPTSSTVLSVNTPEENASLDSPLVRFDGTGVPNGSLLVCTVAPDGQLQPVVAAIDGGGAFAGTLALPRSGPASLTFEEFAANTPPHRCGSGGAMDSTTRDLVVVGMPTPGSAPVAPDGTGEESAPGE